MTKPKDPEVFDEMEVADGAADADARRAAEAEAAAQRAAGPDEPAEADEPGEAEAPGEDGGPGDDGAKPEPEPPAAGEDAPAEDVVEERRPPVEEAIEEPIGASIEEPIEEQGHRSLAATVLMILIGVIAVVAGTLWAAPRVAPHLPASVAQYLMPGDFEAAGEIAALRQSLDAATGKADDRIAGLEARLDAAEAAGKETADKLAALPDQAPVAAEAGAALKQAGAAATEVKALQRRADAVETELIGLRQGVTAIQKALAEGREGGAEAGGVVPGEISAALAALDTRIDSLASAVANRSELQALGDRIDGLAARIDAIEAGAATARSEQDQALGAVSTAIHQASLRSAAAALTSRLEGGQPYAAPLAEVASLTKESPPEALAAGAETGLATAATLGAGFGPAAQAAVAADIQAGAGDGAGSQVLGWLRSQVTGRPVTEQAGDSVGAITSRIAARVQEGDLPAALTEAEALPAPAQAALGGWLDQLRARVAAGKALAAWLEKIGVNG